MSLILLMSLTQIQLVQILGEASTTSATTMATISRVDYPKTLNPGEEAEINVTVEYSSAYEMRVRLYDVGLKKDVEEKVNKVGVTAGTKTYTFNLTAPAEDQIWKLSVYVIYVLPKAEDPDLKARHSETDWYRDLEITVGTPQTTSTTTSSVIRKSGTDTAVEPSTPSLPVTTITTQTIYLVTSLETHETPQMVNASSAIAIVIAAVVIVAAVVFILRSRRRPTAVNITQ